MKPKSVIIVIILFAALCVGMGITAVVYQYPRVDLPDEYKLIKPTDNLKGYWEGGVLHIEFNNKNNK
jgi:V8-like Glu-specific endopeptidase